MHHFFSLYCCFGKECPSLICSSLKTTFFTRSHHLILVMGSRVACLSSALLPAVVLEFCLIVSGSSSTPSPPLSMPAWCTAAPPAWLLLSETNLLLWAQWPSTPSTQTTSSPTCPSYLASRLTWTPAALATPPPQEHQTGLLTDRTPHPAFKLVSGRML